MVYRKGVRQREPSQPWIVLGALLLLAGITYINALDILIGGLGK